MLLVFEGWKNFMTRLGMGEKRFAKKQGNLVDGYKPQKLEQDLRGIGGKAYVKVWGIPRTFCVDCGQPKFCAVSSLQTITESQPHLDLEPLDIITYWICQSCHEEEQLGGALIIKDSDDDEVDSRAERRERTILAWVQNQRAGGASPILFDGNMRRVNEDVR